MKKNTRIAALFLTLIMLFSATTAVFAYDGKIVGEGTGPSGEYLVAKELKHPEQELLTTNRYFMIGNVLYDTDGNEVISLSGDVVDYSDYYIIMYYEGLNPDQPYFIYRIGLGEGNAPVIEDSVDMAEFAFIDDNVLVYGNSDDGLRYEIAATDSSPFKTDKFSDGITYAVPAGYGMIMTWAVENADNAECSLLDTYTDAVISLPEGVSSVSFCEENTAICFIEDDAENYYDVLIDRSGKIISDDSDKDSMYSYISDGIFLKFNDEFAALINTDGTVLMEYTDADEDEILYEYGIPFYAMGDIIVSIGPMRDQQYTCFRIYDRSTFKTDGYLYTDAALLDGDRMLLTNRDSRQGSIYSSDGTRVDTDICIENNSDYLIWADVKGKYSIYDNSLNEIFDTSAYNYVVPLYNTLMVSMPDNPESVGIIDLSGRVIIPDSTDFHGTDPYVVATFDNGASIIGLIGEDGSNQKYYFISYHSLPFRDVQEKAWYYGSVYDCANLGLMRGKSDLDFDPEDNMTRAELTTVLYRLAGEPQVEYSEIFPDVPDNAWYTDAVTWAAQNGIVEGYDDGTFKPNNSLQRDHMAAIFYRYSAVSGRDVTARGNLSDFYDADSVQPWALEAMSWAVGSSLIKGVTYYHESLNEYRNSLVPNNITSRAEVATVLSRYSSDKD